MSCWRSPTIRERPFLAQALVYTAIRAGNTVLFLHADDFFRAMTQAKVGNCLERAFSFFLAPDHLILDYLGLHRLTADQNAELYVLIIGPH